MLNLFSKKEKRKGSNNALGSSRPGGVQGFDYNKLPNPTKSTKTYQKLHWNQEKHLRKISPSDGWGSSRWAAGLGAAEAGGSGER